MTINRYAVGNLGAGLPAMRTSLDTMKQITHQEDELMSVTALGSTSSFNRTGID